MFYINSSIEEGWVDCDFIAMEYECFFDFYSGFIYGGELVIDSGMTSDCGERFLGEIG